MSLIAEPEQALGGFIAAWNDRDATVLEPRRGVTLLVLRRSGDGWSIAAAQNTDIVPGAETMAASPDGLTGADYGGGEAHR